MLVIVVELRKHATEYNVGAATKWGKQRVCPSRVRAELDPFVGHSRS